MSLVICFKGTENQSPLFKASFGVFLAMRCMVSKAISDRFHQLYSTHTIDIKECERMMDRGLFLFFFHCDCDGTLTYKECKKILKSLKRLDLKFNPDENKECWITTYEEFVKTLKESVKYQRTLFFV